MAVQVCRVIQAHEGSSTLAGALAASKLPIFTTSAIFVLLRLPLINA